MRLVHPDLTAFLTSACLVLSLAALGCDDPDPEPGTTTDMSSGSAEGDETAESESGDTDGVCIPPAGDGFGCLVDEDCEIAGDCCSCTAYNPMMGSPGNCGGSCEQNKCEEWGVGAAVCQGGRCVPEGLSCNQAVVICAVEPPACDPGFAPRVTDGCFTGDCLPLEACDWAPSCSSCGADQLCMQEQRNNCDYVRCVDLFPECGAQSEGCCTGQVYCPNNCTNTEAGFSCG